MFSHLQVATGVKPPVVSGVVTMRTFGFRRLSASSSGIIMMGGMRMKSLLLVVGAATGCNAGFMQTAGCFGDDPCLSALSVRAGSRWPISKPATRNRKRSSASSPSAPTPSLQPGAAYAFQYQ
jgi:hypothetical protein